MGHSLPWFSSLWRDLKQCTMVGQALLPLLSSFPASWNSQSSEEWRMGQEQKQPPLKVLWGQQCPDTSLTSPNTTKIEGGRDHSHVLPNTFPQWRADTDFWHYWGSKILPLWHSPTRDPSPGSCLPPATHLFPVSGPHSRELNSVLEMCHPFPV